MYSLRSSKAWPYLLFVVVLAWYGDLDGLLDSCTVLIGDFSHLYDIFTFLDFSMFW